MPNDILTKKRNSNIIYIILHCFRGLGVFVKFSEHLGSKFPLVDFGSCDVKYPMTICTHSFFSAHIEIELLNLTICLFQVLLLRLINFLCSHAFAYTDSYLHRREQNVSKLSD